MALFRPKLDEGAEPERALTAAVAAVDFSEGSSWKTWKFGNRKWQAEVWRLYDLVPEFHFLAGRIGDSISQARLYVTEVDDNGEPTGETSDEAIKQLAAVPLGTGAQRDDNLRLAGIDLSAPGECYFVGEGAAQRAHEASGSWFVVTAAAIKNQSGRITVKRPVHRGGGTLELQNGRDILVRCFRPHPNSQDESDSFARSAIPVLREIETLTKREFAELDSRLTGAGVWFVPEGIDFPRAPEDPAGIGGFMTYMQRAAAASMQDQATASAMVPIIATVPDHMIEQVKDMKPINFWSELSGEIGGMKTAAIERLANSAELPKEVLTGLGAGNHWSAWLISEEGVRWIQGYLTLIAEALTRGFLRLALESMGRGADVDRFAFAFDVSPLAARPNRLEEALQLHDRMLLSDEEVVKAGAFDVEQMPTVVQRAQQLLLKVVQTQPDLMLDPAVQVALGLPQIERVGLPATADQNANGDTSDDDQGNRDDAPDPDEAPALTASLDRRILQLTAAPAPATVLNAACRLHVLRALELAGGRLATPAERAGKWQTVPRHELHTRIGPITPDRADLVTRGSWGTVALTAADFGIDSAHLEALLSGYVRELLTRGVEHHDDLLFAAISMANRGNGMIAA